MNNQQETDRKPFIFARLSNEPSRYLVTNQPLSNPFELSSGSTSSKAGRRHDLPRSYDGTSGEAFLERLCEKASLAYICVIAWHFEVSNDQQPTYCYAFPSWLTRSRRSLRLGFKVVGPSAPPGGQQRAPRVAERFRCSIKLTTSFRRQSFDFSDPSANFSET